MRKVLGYCTSHAKKLILVTALCFTPLCLAQTVNHQGTAVEQNTTQVSPSTTAQTENNVTSSASPIVNTPAPAKLTLEHDLSPWGMYQNADMVVKAVMIGLLLASILTWTIFIAKLIELLVTKKCLRNEMVSLKNAKTLAQASDISKSFGENSLANILIKDIQEELDLSADSTSQEGIKERASFRQDRLVAASGRKMNKGTNILATIGAVSPFIGLFGTVWGIMNSFIGIAKSQTTNLAVVAPGIAEALLATAMGLVAAIPAVIIYNGFTRAINGYRVLVSDISAHALLLLSRDLDRKSHNNPIPNNRSNVTQIG